jgi:hypothetical protein
MSPPHSYIFRCENRDHFQTGINSGNREIKCRRFRRHTRESADLAGLLGALGKRPKTNMQQCAKRASPLDTAAEDIHLVYKSPRPIMASRRTLAETASVSFMFIIKKLTHRCGHYGERTHWIHSSQQNKKATTFASATVPQPGNAAVQGVPAKKPFIEMRPVRGFGSGTKSSRMLPE